MTYRWTHHALQRMTEKGWPVSFYLEAFERSQPHQLSEKQKVYKFSKYGMESLDDVYRYDSVRDVMFTLHSKPKYQLIITVTHGKGNFLGKYART